MTNHYIQMSSDPFGPSIELGEVAADPKMDGNIEAAKMILTNSPDIDPVFKNLKSGHSLNSKMTWWKMLIILLFIVTIILLILLIILLYSTMDTRNRIIDQTKNNKAQVPCFTFPCLQAAVEIKNSINTSVNPCDDFSQFACGKWQSGQVLPKGSPRYSTFDVVNSELYKIQKKLLESSEFKSVSPVYSKAIQLYNSCLNLDRINLLDSKPLDRYISKLFDKYGGWEMQINEINSSLSKWDLLKVLEDPLVETPVFKIVVQEDEKNSTRNIFNVHLSLLLLEKQFLQNELKPENKKIIDAYRDYMYDIGKLLNINKNKYNQFDEILKLEIQVAKKYPKEEELRDPETTYNRMKVSELQNKYCPEFNWEQIFKKRMEYVKMQMNDDMDIIVISPVQLKEICKLFKYDEKTARTIHNYVIWRSVYPKIMFLGEEFQRVKDKFRKVYFGAAGNRDRWEYCVSIVQSHMSLILGNMYIKNNFNRDSKPQVSEMINLLKAKFHENLISNSWMDKSTRSHAIQKIEHMLPLIGYTESILNLTFLEKSYEDIEINEENYFENVDNLLNRVMFKNLEKLQKRPENSTIETPAEVNAFYSPNKNEIIFPAGILQSPFFEPGFPRSLKYGGIGTAMGHEITHGFDDTGSKYDYRGDLRMWWTDQTRKLFKTKSDCFVRQYSKYTLYGNSVNGENTLGENIADNGGIRLTYQVYKDLEKKYGIESSLPGLDYTHDQLFFITFGRLWCSLQTKQSTILEILSNSHTPNRYRVIGTLSNFKEFAEAFNCPLGSPMNPVEKCIVW